MLHVAHVHWLVLSTISNSRYSHLLLHMWPIEAASNADRMVLLLINAALCLWSGVITVTLLAYVVNHVPEPLPLLGDSAF